MQRSAPKQVLDWLGTDPSYRNAAQRVDTLLRLEATLQRAAPELGLCVVAIEGDTLTVATRSSGAAAKCRQLEPSLLAALRGTSLQVNRIRFRPQRSIRPPPAPAWTPRHIPESALAAFEAIGTPSGPGKRALTPLQQALARLVRRHRGGAK